MKGGDISNESPKRIAVAMECVVDATPVVEKVLGIIPTSHIEYTYNRANLSKIWHFSSDRGVIMELVGFGYSQKDMDEVLEDLNNLGTNPFTYAKAYERISDLVNELPYRPELVGVVDLPQNALRYGSWYIDIWRVI
jgi:hypothetical protein